MTINYLIREKFWCSIRGICDAELRKGQDPVVSFWRAFGIFKEGNITEALRELQKIQDRREVSLACCVAMIHYHERCRNVDQEAIDTLIVTLDEKEERSADKDLLVASSFLWHCQQFKRSGQYCQKLMDNSGNSQASLCLRGWIYFSSGK